MNRFLPPVRALMMSTPASGIDATVGTSGNASGVGIVRGRRHFQRIQQEDLRERRTDEIEGWRAGEVCEALRRITGVLYAGDQ